MLSFQRRQSAGGELHTAEFTGTDGSRFVMTLHKYPRERKWTAVLVGPEHRVLIRRRFFASTNVEAARTAIYSVVDALRCYKSAADAILSQLGPDGGDADSNRNS